MVKASRILQYKGKACNLPLVFLVAVSLLPVIVACDETKTTPTPVPTASSTRLINGNATPKGTSSANENGTTVTPNLYNPQATLQPTVQSAGTVLPLPVSDLVAAWGEKLAIKHIPLTLMAGYQLVALTATPDGKELVCSATTVDFNESGGSVPGKALLVDVDTHSITVMHNFPKKDTQMGGASADDRWIVWVEAAQNPDMFADWTLYAYDRTTDITKQIAKAPTDENGALLPSPFVLPKVDHGVAVWIEAPRNPGSSVHGIVKSINLDTGQIEPLTDNGLVPTISWPYVGWIEASAEPSKQLEGAQKSSIVLLNMETGTKKTLSHPDTPSYFEMHKDTIVWITGKSDEVILTDVNETYQQTVARWDGGNALEFPSLNDRLVSWTGNGIPQVWDRLQNRIVQLENRPDYSQFVVANALVWLSPITEPDELTPGPVLNRTINVLETSQLPK